MKYINHITINSGHCRKTYPREVDKQLYFKLHRIFKESLSPDGCDMMGNEFNVKTSCGKSGYMYTLFGYEDGSKVPILTSACSKTDKGELWDMIFTNPTMPLPEIRPAMPRTPYIADRIEIGAMLFFDTMHWIGDFSRCMGWICLYPEAIR